MTKKKPPYVYFCLERQQSDPRLKSKSLPELVELCSDEWKMLSDEQKAPYKETAFLMAENDGRLGVEPPVFSHRSIHSTPVEELVGKFDNLGRSFFALRSRSIQDKRNVDNMLNLIESE